MNNITEQVKNYEDICRIDGVDPVQSLPFPEPQNADETAINGVAKVFRIAKVLNEGWQPDWNDFDQRKYYPWFDLETYPDQAGSGSGFAYYGYDYDCACSLVGARLVYKTSELAMFAGKTFLQEYRDFMFIEK